jgi:hypothetical protein
MLNLDSFITLIVIVKSALIITSALHFYLIFSKKDNPELNEKLIYIKNRIDFIFKVLMAILLIYVFNPRRPMIKRLTPHAILLLYMFGVIMLITDDWGVFVKTAPWFEKFQEIIGGARK